MTTVIVVFRKKYSSLEFSSLTIVVNSEHIITSKHGGMAFLQYKTEAIPGKPLKRKVTQEETRERKKQYEKDRERKFIDSWKQVVL